MRQISELASVARSTLHRKLQEYRASARQTFPPARPDTSPPQTPVNIQQSTAGSNVLTVEIKSTTTEAVQRSSPGTITYNCLKCSLQGSNHFLSLKVQRVRVECLWLVTSFKFHPWGPRQLFLTWNHLKER